MGAPRGCLKRAVTSAGQKGYLSEPGYLPERETQRPSPAARRLSSPPWLS